MKQIGMAAAMVFSIAFLLVALGLGVMASWGKIDPNLHAMAAFLAGVIALGMHIRAGSGLDFLAVVFLVAALALGHYVASLNKRELSPGQVREEQAGQMVVRMHGQGGTMQRTPGMR